MANASKLIDNVFGKDPLIASIRDALNRPYEDDFDEFCDWVHEVRVKAGVEKPVAQSISWDGSKYATYGKTVEEDFIYDKK